MKRIYWPLVLAIVALTIAVGNLVAFIGIAAGWWGHPVYPAPYIR